MYLPVCKKILKQKTGQGLWNKPIDKGCWSLKYFNPYKFTLEICKGLCAWSWCICKISFPYSWLLNVHSFSVKRITCQMQAFSKYCTNHTYTAPLWNPWQRSLGFYFFVWLCLEIIHRRIHWENPLRLGSHYSGANNYCNGPLYLAWNSLWVPLYQPLHNQPSLNDSTPSKSAIKNWP